MKIRITSRNVFTQYGAFDAGNELATPKYTEEFLRHLVKEAEAAEYIEAKMVEPVVENKVKPESKPAKKKSRKKRMS